MSEVKHTPGPWLAATSDTHQARLAVWADGGLAGATQICILPPEFKAVVANARLIAAAPDMLMALRMCMEAGIAGGEARMAARVAIAKATGGEG